MSHDLVIRLNLQRDAFKLQLDVQIPSQGITAILGPSGSGKTSLLRCIAGLEKAQQGYITINDHVWQDNTRNVFLAPWQRSIGYVFQESSLFSHLNVKQNLEYGLKRRSESASRHSLHEAIHLLGIESLLHRSTDSLSGGEKQRVAIARALATQPQLLLLDEPLASLDDARRKDIMPWLEKLRDEVAIPMIYVSHSIEEISRLANHLIAIEDGGVVYQGDAITGLTQRRSSSLITDDIGALIEGTITEQDSRWHLALFNFDGGNLWLKDTATLLHKTVRVRILAKDISLTLHKCADTSIQNLLLCAVGAIEDDIHPSQALVELKCGNSLLVARITKKSIDELGIRPGIHVWAQIKSAALIQ